MKRTHNWEEWREELSCKQTSVVCVMKKTKKKSICTTYSFSLFTLFITHTLHSLYIMCIMKKTKKRSICTTEKFNEDFT